MNFQVRATNAGFGRTLKTIFGVEIDIGALVGDQQSACFAQRCGQAGSANVNFKPFVGQLFI